MKLFNFKKKNFNRDYDTIIWKCICKYKYDERIIAERLLDEIKLLEETENNIPAIISTMLDETIQDILYTQMIKQDFEKGLLMLIKIDISTHLDQKEIISLKIRECDKKIQYLNIKRDILKDICRSIKN
ncbi:hypothetical protein H012_gp790 [Acanthamoeba polyphaga moumouvirus]|uniref:Uncharacterized protein n=1 Tax=Acanthamoeba polyphaga moumouvirus TaxID=1269028 RepID=L7RFR0_9VIRU|nr:hypothetical protein H012_gp790 [Acanthamoeba polyphaga moumouvirus]AGC01675.1 hypothetical protein Moumou_00131 [Acanthamoeba polyphaga moumouvirus]AQN68013.1 hypothetical protein [Saudi moumouvirus]